MLRPEPRDWAPLLAGADYGEAYLETSTGTAIHYEDSKPETITTGADSGVGLRYVNRRDGPAPPSAPAPEGAGPVLAFTTIHGSLNTLDPADAAEVRRRLLGPGAAAEGSPQGLVLDVRPQLVRIPAEEVGVDAKIALLRRVDLAARSISPHVRQVSLTYAERFKSFAILNSAGACHVAERRSVLFAVKVTAEKDGLLQTAFESIGALKGWEAIEESQGPVRAGLTAARRAVAKLEAPPAKAGEMPVVIASSAGGTFVHEAIGHSLEADHVQDGTSPAYKDKVGAAVAPEFITIIDDPTLPFFRGSYPVDDEGVAAAPTAVIERGVLRGYLYDRLTAWRDGAQPNGHGRRESYQHKPIPRMSNLYIAPGAHDPAAILKELDSGLLVARMGGGQVDTATGEFVFEVEEGWRVEEGVPRHMVRDANLLGVGPEVLKSIDRLGWDIAWGIGTCGKEGQGVPVSDGQPTLRIPKMLIGGREQ